MPNFNGREEREREGKEREIPLSMMGVTVASKTFFANVSSLFSPNELRVANEAQVGGLENLAMFSMAFSIVFYGIFKTKHRCKKRQSAFTFCKFCSF